MKYPYPRVGIGVMIKDEEGKVLLGLRKSSHGAGEWCFPGGKLQNGETLFEAAKREVREEVGLEIQDLAIISLADEMRYLESDGKQFFNVGVLAKKWQGEVDLKEPHKYHEWQWFSLDNLPEKILEGTELVINNFLTKKLH